MIGLLVEAERANRFNHGVLCFRLARVNHIINFSYIAEMPMFRLAIGGRNPAIVLVWVFVKPAIAEVAAQQPEFPEMIGDVLAYIDHLTVGANADLLIVFGNIRIGCSLGCSRAPHHPAALVFAFAFISEHARGFQLFERSIPEMEVQDFALTRQKVIFDIEPVPGLKMSPEYRDRDQVRDLRSFISALFNRVQRLDAGLKVLFILLVPLRDAGIQVPAVVIETRLVSELFNFSARLFGQLQKADDHVGNLNAGVIDVILDVDLAAGEAQQANETVAQNRIAKVSDVRGFIRIDAGVLNQHFAGGSRKALLAIGCDRSGQFGTIHAGINVSCTGNFQFLESGNLADAGDNLFGDPAGSLAKFFSKLEGQRKRILAQFNLGRLLDHDFRQIEIVSSA